MELTQKQLEIIKSNSKQPLDFSDEQILEIRKMITYTIQNYPTLKFDEDMLQEISTKIACYSIYKYNPEKSKLSTFLIFCIDNFVKMELRKNKTKLRTKKYTLSLDSPACSDNKDLDFSELIPDNQSANKLEETEFIEFLNKKIAKYKVLRLYYFESLTQVEIAKVLKTSQPHVARLLKRELGQLKIECIKNGFDHNILNRKEDNSFIFTNTIEF